MGFVNGICFCLVGEYNEQDDMWVCHSLSKCTKRIKHVNLLDGKVNRGQLGLKQCDFLVLDVQSSSPGVLLPCEISYGTPWDLDMPTEAGWFVKKLRGDIG